MLILIQTWKKIFQSLDDVLVLSLPPEDPNDLGDKTLWQKYSHERLTDLQSKLMLVAGKAEKGNEEVDRFVQVGPKTMLLELLKI